MRFSRLKTKTAKDQAEFTSGLQGDTLVDDGEISSKATPKDKAAKNTTPKQSIASGKPASKKRKVMAVVKSEPGDEEADEEENGNE